MKSGNGMAGTGTSPWRCWPTPAWRWSGARRWNQEVRGQRGLSQLGRKADTPDGARGPAVALPADMETSTYGRISAAVVPVETAAPGNGPPLPLPTPPETPHHISATVVLGVLATAQGMETDAEFVRACHGESANVCRIHRGCMGSRVCVAGHGDPLYLRDVGELMRSVRRALSPVRLNRQVAAATNRGCPVCNMVRRA